MTTAAMRVIERCRELAAISEVAGETTRPFLCPAAAVVQARVRTWMEAAGLDARMDAMGNLRGISEAAKAGGPRLLLGSHLDTVPNAGAFDGILGVVLAIEAAEAASSRGLSAAIEVIGFSEEEGVRFGRPFLGSLALVGRTAELLDLADRYGTTVAQALTEFGVNASVPAEIAPGTAGYVEVHIEQGPVLESLGRPLGIVSAIAGQSRYTLQFRGKSNHAGTTPMSLRHDALAAAAEWITEVERRARAEDGLVATVGRMEVRPGASNIVPGDVVATMDVRHGQDAVRERAVRDLLGCARAAAEVRGVALEARTEMNQRATAMDGGLIEMLGRAASEVVGDAPPRLTSGAGHDAMIVASKVPSAMLFVRSPGGLSHHPDESVLPGDVAAAIETTVRFLEIYSTHQMTHATEAMDA